MVVKKIIKYLKENPKKEVSIGHTGGIKKKALEGDMGFKKSKTKVSDDFKIKGKTLMEIKNELYDEMKKVSKEVRKITDITKGKIHDIGTRKAAILRGAVSKYGPGGIATALGIPVAAVIGTGATLTASSIHGYYKKKKRQKSGTKHLGSKKQKKAYGGKVNTYRSPRRTTYND